MVSGEPRGGAISPQARASFASSGLAPGMSASNPAKKTIARHKDTTPPF